MSKLCLFFFVLLLSACTIIPSKRAYERPDFSLTGEAANKEIERFRLDEISPQAARFQSEKSNQYAHTEDVKPLVEEVSPKAIERIEKSKIHNPINWTLFGLWIATNFIDDGKYWWYGLGANVGWSIYMSNYRENTATQFNKDLKAKFRPTLSYLFQF